MALFRSALRDPETRGQRLTTHKGLHSVPRNAREWAVSKEEFSFWDCRRPAKEGGVWRYSDPLSNCSASIRS